MILVVGATGALGGTIARSLLERGERVRVLARPGSDVTALEGRGAEVARGDLKDPASLRAACRGAEVVITTANSAARGGEDNAETVDLTGNRALVDAAREAGVRQFVFTSAIGGSEESPVPFLRAKGLTERHLRESGVPYTILVPNIFMDVWIPMLVGMPVQQGEPVTLIGEGRRRHSLVALADVAAYAVAAVRHPEAVDLTLPVGGPTAVSWLDVVAATEAVLGQPVPVRHIAHGESIPGLPEVVSQLATFFDTYDSPTEMEGPARTFGVTGTPMRAFVERLFASVPPPTA